MKAFITMYIYEIRRTIPLAGMFWVLFAAACASVFMLDISVADKNGMIGAIIIPAAMFSHPVMLWYRFKIDCERNTRAQLFSLPVRRWPLFAASAGSFVTMLLFFLIIIIKTSSALSSAGHSVVTTPHMYISMLTTNVTTTYALAFSGICIVVFGESCSSCVRQHQEAVSLVAMVCAAAFIIWPLRAGVPYDGPFNLFLIAVLSVFTGSAGLALLEWRGEI